MLIGITVIVALLFRYLAYRQRKIVEPRRDYHCISAKMYWGDTKKGLYAGTLGIFEFCSLNIQR